MHHTDYYSNLRKAQHKTHKIWLLRVIFNDCADDKSKELLRAAVAAVLIIIALLQMDPANAQPTMDTGGYGTLHLGAHEAPIRALVLSSELKLIIHDDKIKMIIDQTFSNQTLAFHSGEYWFELPANADVKSWRLILENCPMCTYSNNPKCQLVTKLVSSDPSATATHVNGRLRIPTPAMTPDQRVSIHLDIDFPNTATHLPATAMRPFAIETDTDTDTDTDLQNSVSAAVESMGTVAVSHAFGVMQPL